MAVIGETDNERREREGVNDEVLHRSHEVGEYIDQFCIQPPLTNAVLNRLPRCVMGLPLRSLPKTAEPSYIYDEAIKKLCKECNDIQIATRRDNGR